MREDADVLVGIAQVTLSNDDQVASVVRHIADRLRESTTEIVVLKTLNKQLAEALKDRMQHCLMRRCMSTDKRLSCEIDCKGGCIACDALKAAKAQDSTL